MPRPQQQVSWSRNDAGIQVPHSSHMPPASGGEGKAGRGEGAGEEKREGQELQSEGR